MFLGLIYSMLFEKATQTKTCKKENWGIDLVHHCAGKGNDAHAEGAFGVTGEK